MNWKLFWLSNSRLVRYHLSDTSNHLYIATLSFFSSFTSKETGCPWKAMYVVDKVSLCMKWLHFQLICERKDLGATLCNFLRYICRLSVFHGIQTIGFSCKGRKKRFIENLRKGLVLRFSPLQIVEERDILLCKKRYSWPYLRVRWGFFF